MCHLYEWQNVPPISAHGPIVNPLYHIELSNDLIVHSQHFKNQITTNEPK